MPHGSRSGSAARRAARSGPATGRRAVLLATFRAYAMGAGASSNFDVPALGSAASHYVDVRLHGALSVTLGLLAIAVAAVTEHPVAVAAVGAGAVLGGIQALLREPRRVSAQSLAIGHMMASAGNCAVAVLSGNPMDFTAGPVVIIIVILHAACLRSRRETWLQLLWALTLYGATLLLFGNGSRAIGAWSVLAVTLVLLAGTVTLLRARVDLLVAELRRLAEHDVLTGLLNRQGLRRRLDERAAAGSGAGSGPGSRERIAALLVDVDRFKQINDRFGHPAGDSALAWLGTQLVASAGLTALVSRHGGEEFLVVLPIASANTAARAAEQIRSDVQAHSRTQAHAFTVSIGIAVGALDGDFTELIRRADAGLYLAKEAGRNHVTQAAS